MSDAGLNIINGSNGAAQHTPRVVAGPKHERFLRLAQGRVQRALDALEQVARLSIPENEYTEQEMSQILVALQMQMAEVERRLSRKKEGKKIFAFD
jgi:DICT domain-containing protein